MMRNLEKLAYDPATPPFQGDADVEFQPYRIITEDLRLVKKAVSQYTYLGRPMFASVSDQARILSHGRNFDSPKTYEVRALQRALYEHEKRFLEKRSLDSPADKSSEESGDDEPADFPLPPEPEERPDQGQSDLVEENNVREDIIGFGALSWPDFPYARS
ncbi:hypothetical protein F4677DRAFT_424536 [Hypoxylon crocopeplum]|nr:hypothetical protein F4677DRAFT_424536 [Hypoxylon crocopeplum]